MTITMLGSAGSVFLFWHFLMLGLCATGLAVERILRARNALVRSVLLRGTLAITVATPLLCLTWNALPARIATPAVAVMATAPPAHPFAHVDWNQVAVWRPLVNDIEQVPTDLLPEKTSGIPWTAMAYASFLGASAFTSLILFSRFIVALLRCATLRKRGKPLPPAAEARLRSTATAMNAPAPCALVVENLESPVLIGFLRPVILLPADMTPRDEVFIHELTHLRRRDLTWHLLARLAAMLMPLQPGFWRLRRALDCADEDVCDDAVLVRGANLSAYAELLLKVAESQRGPNPDLCLPMAAFRSQLERRLHRLLDATRPLARCLSLPVLYLSLGPLLAAGILAVAIFLDTEHSALAAEGGAASPKPASTQATPVSNVSSSQAQNGQPTTDVVAPPSGQIGAIKFSLDKPLPDKYAWAAKYAISSSTGTDTAPVDPSTTSNSPSQPVPDSLQPDYSVWLAHAKPEEKDALASAYKAVDKWHTAIDSGKKPADTAPRFLNNQPVTADDWQAYLAGPYSQWGQVQSRKLHLMMRGWVDGAKANAITSLTVVYEIKYTSSTAITTVLEELALDRGPDHQWHIDKYSTQYASQNPVPNPPTPTPDHVSSPPLIRSISVECVGGPSSPVDSFKAKIIEAAGFTVGIPCRVGQLHRAAKDIYATGEVVNVALKAQPIDEGGTITGIDLSIVVEPNPVVKHIAFDGIDATEQAKLVPLLHVKPGTETSDKLIFQDAQTLTSELAKEGLNLAVKGTSALHVDSPHNTTDVTFKITPL